MTNQKLLNQILDHIYGNLGLTKKILSPITTDAFHLKEGLLFSDEEGEYTASLWSAQANIGAVMKILCADFSVKSNSEYAVIVELEKCPTYGCYLCFDNSSKESFDGLLAFFTNGKWLETSTYLQATFLAGMENLKDFHQPWVPATKPYLIDKMKSFIQYSDSKVSSNE
jgi:hypothetical protein